MKSGRFPASRAFRTGAALLLALSAGGVRAENDPYRSRVRGLTDVPYPSYQGDRCTTIDAPRTVVWGVLTDAARSGAWLLADADVVPMGARLKKGSSLAKGEVLVLSVDTKEGPRNVELTVLVSVENQLLALAVTKDDDVITRGTANLIYTFVLEEPEKGKTDLYWASHYDSDSPLAAAVSPLKGGKRRFAARVEHGLLVLWGMAEAAGALETTGGLPVPPPVVRGNTPTPTPRPTPPKRPRRRY